MIQVDVSPSTVPAQSVDGTPSGSFTRRTMLAMTGAVLGAGALGVRMTGVASALPQHYLVMAPECEVLGHLKLVGSTSVSRVRLVARAMDASAKTVRTYVGAADPETDVAVVPGLYNLSAVAVDETNTPLRVDGRVVRVAIYDADSLDEGTPTRVRNPVLVEYCPTEIRVRAREGQLQFRNIDLDFDATVTVTGPVGSEQVTVRADERFMWPRNGTQLPRGRYTIEPHSTTNEKGITVNRSEFGSTVTV